MASNKKGGGRLIRKKLGSVLGDVSKKREQVVISRANKAPCCDDFVCVNHL